MKKIITKFMTICMLAAMVMTLSGCDSLFNRLFGIDGDGGGGDSGSNNRVEAPDIDLSKEMSEEEEMELIDNGIVYDEESEGAKLTYRPSSDVDYLGSWSITSGNAIYLYGNFKITIQPNRRWHGKIVDEKVSGKWTFAHNKMTLTSDFFNADLQFTNDGTLVMQENRGSEEEPDIVTVVLTRVDD